MSGLYIFGVVSLIALFGTFFKLFYTGRYEKLSLLLYLFICERFKSILRFVGLKIPVPLTNLTLAILIN